MARKTARETKLEASIKALLDGAVQNGTFDDVCSGGKKVLIDAANLINFPLDKLGETQQVYLSITTENFMSKYFDSDDIDRDDFDVEITVKHNGKVHKLDANDVHVFAW